LKAAEALLLRAIGQPLSADIYDQLQNLQNLIEEIAQ
jgi:hypothetical protein